MLNLSLWLSIAIFLASLSFTYTLTSVPLTTYREDGLQTRIFFFSLLDIVQVKSQTQTATTSYQSIALPFKTAKTTPLDEQNILLGIFSMDYIIKNPLNSSYEMDFYLETTSVTLTSLVIQLNDALSHMVIFKASVMIMSSEYKDKYNFEIHQISYTYSDSFRKIFSLLRSTTPTAVYYYFCGAQLKPPSGQIKYSFSQSLIITSSPYQLNSEIIVTGASGTNFVRISLLVIYPGINPPNPHYQAIPYAITHRNTAPSLDMEIAKKMTNSEVFYGLNEFVYDTTAGDSTGFLYIPTFSTDLRMEFQLDDQFYKFYYQGLLINHYSCKNGDHYIFAMKGTQYECFDGCQVAQYASFDSVKGIYQCSACSETCATCYNATACKTCLKGFDLAENFSCLLNPSYYLVTLLVAKSAQPCYKERPNCQKCAVTGLSCFSCKSNAFINRTEIMYQVTYTTAAGAFTYNTGDPIVYCDSCQSKFANCNSCNSSMCFDCMPGFHLQDFNNCTATPIPPVVYDFKHCTDSLRCQKCLQVNLYNCLKCYHPSHQILNGQCSNPCGDGVILDEEVCDDGNNLSIDGCSADCLTIEDGWDCQTSLLGHSQCHYTRPISLSVVSIKKTLNENKVTILMQNDNPFVREWMAFNASELKAIISLRVPQFAQSQHVYSFDYAVRFVRMPAKILPKNPLRLLQTTSDPFDHELYKCVEMEIKYTSDRPDSLSLNHQPVVVSLKPALSDRANFQGTPLSETPFELVSDDCALIQYFSADFYRKYGLVKTLSQLASILVLVILVMAFLAFCLDGNNSRQILLAVETAGVVQFTYFSLMGIGELNPLFVAMTEGLKFSCGFDLPLTEKETAQKALLVVGIDSASIMSNVNISLGVVLVFLVVGSVLLLIDKIRQRLHRQSGSSNDHHDQVENLDESQRHSVKSSDEKQTQTNSDAGSRLQRWTRALIANFSFGCFLFFLYKFTTFVAIQVRFSAQEDMDSAFMILLGIVLLMFTVLVLFKLDLFDLMTEKLCTHESFEEKENRLNDDEGDGTFHIAARARRQKVYLLFLAVERIANSLSLVFLMQVFSLHGLIPMALSLCQIVYMMLWDKNLYNQANKYRLYFNCCIGIVIQAFLLAKKTMNGKMEAGMFEGDEGEYLPLIILGLLFLVLSVGLIFEVYSIKKIRCVQLEFEWEKIDQKRKNQILKRQELQKKRLQDTKLKLNAINDANKYLTDKQIDKNNESQQKQRKARSQNNKQQRLRHGQELNSVQQVERQLIVDEENSKDECNQEGQFDSEFEKNDQVCIYGKQTEQKETNVKLLKKQVKKDIKKRLIESKLPNSSKDSCSSNLLSDRQHKQAKQDLEAQQENTQSPYKYTDRHRYSLYQVYDQI